MVGQPARLVGRAVGLGGGCAALFLDVVTDLGDALSAESGHFHDVDDSPPMHGDRVFYRVVQGLFGLLDLLLCALVVGDCFYQVAC